MADRATIGRESRRNYSGEARVRKCRFDIARARRCVEARKLTEYDISCTNDRAKQNGESPVGRTSGANIESHDLTLRRERVVVNVGGRKTRDKKVKAKPKMKISTVRNGSASELVVSATATSYFWPMEIARGSRNVL